MDFQAAPTLPNLRGHHHHHHHEDLVSLSAVIQSGQHKAQPCCGGVWKQKSCCVVEGEILLVSSLWEIAVTGEKGCSNSSLQLKHSLVVILLGCFSQRMKNRRKMQLLVNVNQIVSL